MEYGADKTRDRRGTFSLSLPLRRLKSTSPSRSSDESSLSRATTLGDDGIDDTRGPLGLNLLFSPSEVEVDLIFVHGLGGGSRKTWSKTDMLRDFWPAEWLPKDPGFSRVRIHSYGYDSNWAKGNNSCLNIHHFGKSFLIELSTSPHIENSMSPIVLIGHSMGGLVIKRAYMLARQDHLFTSLADRIRAIYFLGTPHRGSDSAKLLKNILHVASSAPAYVPELVRGSGSLQAINDEFRQFSDQMELWSFYETQKLSTKGFSTIIVDPESAILGYREERQVPMNADHRSICKFETPHDQNYTTIRNSLISTITRLSRSLRPSLTGSLTSTSHESLPDWLGLSELGEEDLSGVQEARVPGTCEWFLTKESYRAWREPGSEVPALFWLSGKPATGKSVLSGAVVDDIQSLGFGCAYYFFKHGDMSASKMTTCLRSLVLQMAAFDENVHAKLRILQEENTKIDLDNERNLWRLLFVSGIFPVMVRPFYWVLDGLDECTNVAPLFEAMLPKIDSSLPLRIFITSRQTPAITRHFSTLPLPQVWPEEISAEETMQDIKTLVNSRAGALIAENEQSKSALIERVVQKSNGLFLWTRLVMDELSSAFSEEDAKRVLDEVPHGMECLYHRALDVMRRASRGQALALAILEWSSCAMRPLTVQELAGALAVELEDKFPDIANTVTALCGQLVTIDRSGRVQMIHETAREFITDSKLSSDFAVKKREAHTKIARVCLKYLVGDELKPPRTARRPPGQSATNKRSAFSTYAFGAFSYHLAQADPSANDVLSLVHTFLKTNILTWIEHTSQARSLPLMVKVAKDLKQYHSLCIAERSPLSSELQRMKTWTTDLQRVAAKFSDALTRSPSAIFSLIPPFCPIQSAIYNTTRAGRRLKILGPPNLEWDDRLSCVDFRQGKTSALCYGGEYLAVGLIGGRISLYHPTSAQEFRVLEHGETVSQLEFKSQSDLLVSCGVKTIRVWDVRTGRCLQTLPAPRKCLKLWFERSLLLAASTKSEISSWDLGTTPADSLPKRQWRDSADEDGVFLARPPMAYSIGIAHQMLAVGYSGQPITIWDLEGDCYYGTCGKKLPTGDTATFPLQALQFNPNKDIELLAASYLDGDLVILDPFSDTEIERQRLSCHTLTASPDGRFLAGGGAGGVIQILEFDTLKPVYKVRTSDLWIKQLAFSHDGMQLADLRGSQCNIWTPPVLLAGSIEGDVSVDTSDTLIDSPGITKQPKITALASSPNGILCGKEDGRVCLFDPISGGLTRELYHHKASIRILQWLPKTGTVLSVCVSNRIQAWPMQKLKTDKSWKTESPLLDFRLDCEGSSVVSVVAGEEAGKLILSTWQSDHLWDIGTAKEESRLTYGREDQALTRIWFQHPESPAHLVCVRQDNADIYDWKGWAKVATLPFSTSIPGLQTKSVLQYTSLAKECRLLLELQEIGGSTETKRLVSLCVPKLPLTSTTPQGAPITVELPDKICRHVSHVVGIQATGSSNRLVFLDGNSWVCSVDLNVGMTVSSAKTVKEATSSYTRHFFVPYDWFAGSRRLLGAMASNKNVIFARNGDIAVVKGGLDFSEPVSGL
ncbi:hypothetical protein QBC37DRAFT_431000 [Rhypophila decipiens]|uniref:GPI inositol-deacylase n=1 Tax=Rhypophila decipiens TaxID=261697 RepID=A0AAN6Y0C1_9PEZI|nr:hypothetical protein QBC37DRAFT_431000 [Rhypophila decipiens]